ncbi:hypothetical protein SAMN02910409_1986 [Prevotellaceae bacterium HUN156]|nr:hypothetical protein SAMN02910409_1986 [Prevotellaceae bacterium HUN156]
MSKTEEILERLKGLQPMIDNPDALTDRIMSNLPDQKLLSEKDDEVVPPGAVKFDFSLHWVAAAAAILLILGVGLTLFPGSQPDPQNVMLAEELASMRKDSSKSVLSMSVRALQYAQECSLLCKHETAMEGDRETDAPATIQTKVVNKQPTTHQRPQEKPVYQSKALSNVPIHYASLVNKSDSNYQDPARVDEFIAKMANYHKVKAVPLTNTTGEKGKRIVNTAYVFPDKQELDLFGRLLQVACWYDKQTPGYQLNFSQKQFVFCLKDTRKDKKYLWIAERIGGERILLYCTHSPIAAKVSSDSFQNYRAQLVHTNMNTIPF